MGSLPLHLENWVLHHFLNCWDFKGPEPFIFGVPGERYREERVLVTASMCDLAGGRVVTVSVTSESQ